jgi:predicted Zn finger-like uncharacterized protein
MPITLNCPKCHKPFRVRDESIGGRVRCPSCGSVLQVPSALSPASNFGDEPKPEAGGSAGTPRPVAEDVPPGASRAGTASDLMFGGPGRAGEAIDFNVPAGTHTHGPPSIRAHVPMPTHAPTHLPSAPTPSDRGRSQPVRLPTGDEGGWGRVHGGLGMVRWAMFLCAFAILCAFGHAAWLVIDPDGAMKEPGFLGKPGWARWKEVALAYTVGPMIPAALLLLLGRLRCGGAPPEANARGLALGAAFFTFVGLAGLGLYVGMRYFELGPKLNLPDPARRTALYAGVASALLADVLTMLFVGQIGWPLNRPRLQKTAAWMFVYTVLFPTAVLIGHLWYPAYQAAHDSWQQSGSPLGAGESNDLAQRVMIWSVVILAGVMLLFLRYASVAGAGRRAIRRHLTGEA